MNFRQLILDELKASPSLKPYVQQIYLECYSDAGEIGAIRSDLPLDSFPEMPIADLEQVLDKNWLPRF